VVNALQLAAPGHVGAPEQVWAPRQVMPAEQVATLPQVGIDASHVCWPAHVIPAGSQLALPRHVA
jgi:hypothetical protein